MFLFILESIGTPELIMIAVVALIIFGPRKMPELARKFGKTMAEFRSATNEFKSTWAREANLESEAALIKNDLNMLGDPTTETDTAPAKTAEPSVTTAEAKENIPSPEIKEMSPEEISRVFKDANIQNNTQPADEPEIETPEPEGKRHWL